LKNLKIAAQRVKNHTLITFPSISTHVIFEHISFPS